MRRTAIVALSLLMSGPVLATDCELGGRYLSLAQEQLKNFATDEAEALLQKSVEACPTYEAYERLAELAAQSSEPESKTRAVDAFLKAYELAQTDEAVAESLHQYASLLNSAGDPQNAYGLIKSARTLNPTDARIVALDARLDQQIRNPTSEQLRAGLKSTLYRPLPWLPSPGPGNKPTDKKPLPRRPDGGSNTVPIHFLTGTTIVDDATRPNIKTLAGALADTDFSGRTFVLIGHADERGTDEQNMELSRQRATAIRTELLSLQPSLKGRLEIDGRGELDPLDAGHSEDAYRTNRRIQVLTKQ